MLEGGQLEMQVFTICTINCGIPVVEYLLCEMLISLFEQKPKQKKKPIFPTLHTKIRASSLCMELMEEHLYCINGGKQENF